MISLAEQCDTTAQDDWGPWQEWKGGECPIPWAKAGEFRVRILGGAETYGGGSVVEAASYQFDWVGQSGGAITAFCLKRTAQPPQAPAELWYPPQQEGFGPWVEHDGLRQPVADGTVVQVLGCDERAERDWENDRDYAENFYWDRHELGVELCDVVAAYCICIEATTPIHEEDEEDGGELDIGAILEGLRKHFGGEAFAAAARPFKPKPGLLWTRDAADAVNAALQAREQGLKAQHEAMLRRDYE